MPGLKHGEIVSEQEQLNTKSAHLSRRTSSAEETKSKALLSRPIKNVRSQPELNVPNSPLLEAELSCQIQPTTRRAFTAMVHSTGDKSAMLSYSKRSSSLQIKSFKRSKSRSPNREPNSPRDPSSLHSTPRTTDETQKPNSSSKSPLPSEQHTTKENLQNSQWIEEAAKNRPILEGDGRESVKVLHSSGQSRLPGVKESPRGSYRRASREGSVSFLLSK